MAGHSHWAGIKHKKGRQDKERSRIFSKLSREITVAAKLGAKDPDSNPRLRSAIQAAKESNMPKDNISRAINKSELNSTSNYSNLRYEGYGPFNVALIIETLSDNKNRTASKIRQILQKGGGNLGESGSTSYLFYNCGVIGVEKTYFSEEEILEIAINAGSKDCRSKSNFHEVITEKEDFYKVKTELEKKIKKLSYSGIEWRPKSLIEFKNNDEKKKVIELLEELDANDDVQNIFTNANLENKK